MTPPLLINDLCDRYERNRDSYKSDNYKEANARKEFIDPLFELLGWDMDNKQGFAEAYKDVVHEDSIRIGNQVKAPDYCFRIGGQRKFFLEAKRPGKSIDDKDYAYQIRRYAWSAKLPLAILTNFREFAVYDCRFRPDSSESASKHRIEFFEYDKYIDKWGYLTSTFTKDAINKGSFDKYAISVKGKRGTQSVDAAFLIEIEQWRKLLAKNLKACNAALKMEQLNFAVGRIIDRIIFLRVCEDRGIEEYGELQILMKGPDKYKRLVNLFLRADERFNSGLFHFRYNTERKERHDEITSTLDVSDDTIRKILKTLYYPVSPYDFRAISADILGHVYEEFLGKVIVNSGRTVDIEEKPEVRKAGGVYYTPTYIVDYIVKHTVGKLVEGKTPEEVSKLCILDPACGSGSFLIGAYQSLLDWHLTEYKKQIAASNKKSALPIFESSGGYRLTLAERKRILCNNIYGVDVDEQAVEVTKLSLLLKVLEGANATEVQGELALRHHALPDLGRNIQCGNSLVGQDIRELFPDMGNDEIVHINPFDWKEKFEDVFKQGGFDAVIGNPPYGAGFGLASAQYLKNTTTTFVWRGESYVVFIEKAIALLKNGGLFGYIVPDTYLNLSFTQPLRDLLLEATEISEVVVLPSNIFDGATVDTTLLLFKKRAIRGFEPSSIAVKLFDKKIKLASLSEPRQATTIDSLVWQEEKLFNVQVNRNESKIISKADKMPRVDSLAELFYGIKVYQVGKGKPPQSEEIRDSKPFTSANRRSKAFSPMFDGKHVGRYSILWQENNWVKYGPWLAEPRKPEKYEGEKILIRKIVGKTLIASYYPETSYCNTLLFTLKLKGNDKSSYKYLLGLLNSPFIGWYYRKKFQISDTDTFPQIMVGDIAQLPIPKADKAHHNKMVKLVERMLELNKKLPEVKTPGEREKMERQIAATDREIDLLVYELYNLTPEEIEIVEGRPHPPTPSP